MINLDYYCMKYGQKICDSSDEKKSDKENLVTKALGVLQENGVYAMFLYLETKNKKKIAASCRDKIKEMLKEKDIGIYTGSPAENEFYWIQDIAKDLDKLLFVKQLCQQTLTYARYHIKALEDKKDETKKEQK